MTLAEAFASLRDWRGLETSLTSQPWREREFPRLFPDRRYPPNTLLVVSALANDDLLLEVQALVSATHFPSPRRMAMGIDSNRVALLLAVLEKARSAAFEKWYGAGSGACGSGELTTDQGAPGHDAADDGQRIDLVGDFLEHHLQLGLELAGAQVRGAELGK